MELTLQKIRVALSDFTMEVDATFAGPATAIFGPSGAGKTSLLEAIAGLRRIESGRIVLGDQVLSDHAAGFFVPPQRRGVGYVPQDGALFPHLSPRANLLFGYREDAARKSLTFEHVVEVLEVAPLLDRAISSLSGGERQRIALGRALLAVPRLLLMDEPLAGLDLGLKERLYPFLRRVHESFGIPVIHVTHLPDEVMSLCQAALVLERGRIRKFGPVEDIFRVSTATHYKLTTTA